MATSRRLNRAMAIALAAGITTTGVITTGANGSPFSPVSIAQAQTDDNGIHPWDNWVQSYVEGNESTAYLYQNEPFPEGTHIRPGESSFSDDDYEFPSWITYDESNQTITSKAGQYDNVLPGTYEFLYWIHEPGSSYESSGDIKLNYSSQGWYIQENGSVGGINSLDPGESTVLTGIQIDHVIPEGAQYEFVQPEGVPDWIELDPDTGEVRVNVPEDITYDELPRDGGSMNRIRTDYSVHMTWPDESNEYSDFLVDNSEGSPIYLQIEVNLDPTEEPEPTPEPEEPVVTPDLDFDGDRTLEQGETETVPAPEYDDGTPFPEGTEFEGGTDNPEWITTNPDGTVTVTVPGEQAPGDYPYEVIVTTPEGNPETVTGTITVLEPSGEDNDPVEETDTPGIDFEGDRDLYPGDEIEVPAPEYDDGAPFPEGTEFEGGPGNPEWITTNPDGTVTIEVPEGQEPGDYPYEVIVTVPGGDPVTVTGTITVLEPSDDNDEEPIVEDNGPESSVDVNTRPVNDDTEYDKDPIDYGPKVKTGGNVNNVTLWDQIKGLFR